MFEPKSKSALNSRQPSQKSAWSLLIIGILFTGAVVVIFQNFAFSDRSVFWRFSWLMVCFWALIAYVYYKSTGISFDFFVMMLLIWWLFGGVGYPNIAFSYLPLITAMWITITHKMSSKYTILLAFSVPLLWFLYFNQTPVRDFYASHYLYLASSMSMLFIHGVTHFGPHNGKIRKIDIIVSSYSGNTAHYADHFIRGAEQVGAEVTNHGFHYYKQFKPQLNGEALVIAFPIFGCKPPWPFLYYLCFKLPKGKSKPAFILYTCMGGAENAGILCWLVLTLKGYRVKGRNWSVYPLNVPTFRLGPRRLWKFLDSLSPIKWDIQNQMECGRRFALGLWAGIPFIFGLTPCFLAGILLDNKWLDTILYRNHVMKKRCNKCGICVQCCPAQRLTMVNGYPKSKGECMICMRCVNLCPQNAMHLWGFTEYGNRYPPKYKEHMQQLNRK